MDNFTTNKKQCGGCKEVKNFSLFNKCAKSKFGLHNHCRKCQKKYKRRHYELNREKELLLSKIYSKSEVAKQKRKEMWARKKDILGPKSNARRRGEHAKIKAREQRKRWLLKPHNKIACNLRRRIRRSLKGCQKKENTEELTGCSFEDLQRYIESQFTENMTWNNYGEWHIDHKIPCSSFDLTNEEERKKCFHYSNLQPLWAKDNLSKGAKIL